MNCEKLIELVKEREEIYNTKHIHHRNRDLIAAIWKYIGYKLKTSDVEAKNKWQNLRSNYMRERRKLKTTPSGAEADGAKISWPFFSMMSFLDNSLRIKRTTGSVSGDSEELGTSRTSLDEGVNSYANEEIYEDCDTDSQEEVTPVNLRKKIRKQKSTDDEVDRQYLKHLDKLPSAAIDNNDPDLLFFKSLLPQIKQLDSTENLSFKVEVAQLLQRKLQRAVRTSSTGTSNVTEHQNLQQKMDMSSLPSDYYEE